ncbi:substrate-binding domain-containing protein [Streptomyces himalayensis]|uniref:DeoR/GlpR family transcriptional regulator n=1 Tax=Streptomyces himalayensis subsp. himalayensis TaxID=2756131 RepID=A0A7W0DT98_9ACTN|nr:substrate-binding domain-containing protein [Streptomyces himalayensis]MBA2950846.1 DeoR/GlpR family transcriptional regulator [Streptomyces himalayensis subsp. himalayensis]
MTDEGSPNVHAEERYQEILRRLRERGSIRVSDVAAELNVSPITVRRDVGVLADRGLVARVHGGATLPPAQQADEEAGAAPQSVHAAPGAREAVFGLVVPAADYYYPEVIKGASEAAAARGVRLVLGISQYSADEEQAQVERMLADGIDGLLITPCDPAAARERLQSLAIPHVLVERRPDDDTAGTEWVVSDHAYGARIAVRHLSEAGRGRIGLLLRDDSPHGAHVLAGYREGLAAVGHKTGEKAAGRKTGEETVFRLPPPGGNTAERERRLGEFTAAVADRRLDAVLIHNDHDAIVVLRRLRAQGVDVPRDLAIVAYDDEVAALADIPLTAVAPPKHAVGAAAVDLLAQRLADPSHPRRRLALLPDLRVRTSSTQSTPVS